MRYVEVYLREVDSGTDNACWVPALKGDPGAHCFSATIPDATASRRRDDWHYDSQGYCDNPGRGY